MVAPDAPRGAALRYYGGKWRLASWILGHFPKHTCYVEPFGGAASVLLQKRPSRLEVYNDADGSVVNFFRVLRERPDDFRRAVELTPFAREEAELACAPEADDSDGPADDLERARRFYVRSWQTIHGAPARGKLGWRYERVASRTKTALETWTETERIAAVATRLRLVQLEHGDAFATLERFDGPETLFYVDPPYVQHLRGARWRGQGYAVEIGEGGHIRLAEALRRLTGMVVLSGFDCELYQDLYPVDDGWQRAERPTLNNASKVSRESLWLSPRTVARLGFRLVDGFDASGEAAG